MQRPPRKSAYSKDLDRQSALRHSFPVSVELAAPDRLPVASEVTNLSRLGFCFISPMILPVGTALAARLPDIGKRRSVVVSQDGCVLTCRFSRPITLANVAKLLA